MRRDDAGLQSVQSGRVIQRLESAHVNRRVAQTHRGLALDNGADDADPFAGRFVDGTHDALGYHSEFKVELLLDDVHDVDVDSSVNLARFVVQIVGRQTAGGKV